MATPEDQATMRALELEISMLVQAAELKFGEKITLAALTAAAASFVGQLDRARPNLNVLAAWHRAFVVMYDANYFQPDLTARTVPWKKGDVGDA